MSTENLIKPIQSASVTSVDVAKYLETLSAARTPSASAAVTREFVDWAEKKDAQRETLCARCIHQLVIVVCK